MPGQVIAGLADRPDHIDGQRLGVRPWSPQGYDAVPGLVEGRPDQVVHGRVDDHEAASPAVLDVEHLGDEDPGVANDQAPRLEDEAGVEAPGRLPDHLRVCGHVGRALVAVGDAQPAAQVEARERQAGAPQLRVEGGHALEGRPEGRQPHELRTDVHRQALQVDARHLHGLPGQLARQVEVDPELVLGLARGDLFVGLGVHVRVDPQRDRRLAAAVGGDTVERCELGRGLDVELQDADIQRRGHFLGRLANPGEDDPLGRDAGGERDPHFALGDHVGAGALAGQRAHHREIGVGLEGIADERVHVGQGRLEVPVGRLHGGRGIAVERCADGRGDVAQRHLLDVQHVAAIGEVAAHGAADPSSAPAASSSALSCGRTDSGGG